MGIIKLLGCISLLFLTIETTYAKNWYVIDTLRVPIRSGPSNAHRVIKVLKSGTRLKVTSKGDNEDFVQVKTPDSLEGWIRSRYISDQPIARDRLVVLEKRYKPLIEEKDKLKAEIKDLTANVNQLSIQKRSIETKNVKLEQELKRISSLSGNVIEIDNKNKLLSQENGELSKRLEQLKTENEKLNSSTRNEGIKLGIGAVMLGLILGIILPYLKPPRRRDSRGGIRLR